MKLPTTWNKLRFHPAHAAMWSSEKRFIAAVAGRGSGKTELARRRIVLSLAIKKEWPNPIYAYCLPTYNQAKKVAWKPILGLLPEDWIKKNGVNVSDMSIETIFGSTLYVVGMDKPHRIEGLQLDGVVLDESSDQRPGVFEKTIIPMLTHRRGWCWRIGVPKRAGIGRIDFKAFFERGLKGDPNIDSFHWLSSEILTEDQLEAEKAQLDAQDFEEQFNAKWLDVGGTIYYAFSQENVTEDAKYDPSLPIYVGCDFNVDPMCWILSHRRDGAIYVFDEVFFRNTNTEATLHKLKDMYASHEKEFFFFGDAAGRARKTNAVRTDYLIIKQSGIGKTFFLDRNPPVRDRFACVNASLCNAKGERTLFINPKCKRLITDLGMMSYKERTTEPEDYAGTDIGHMVDALGYLVYRIAPIRLKHTTAPIIAKAL